MFSMRVKISRLRASSYGPGTSERFSDRGERLLDVKIRVAFPTRIDIEFPAHAR